LCEDPICVASCPRDALTKDEKTGIILVDEEKCNGCAWCIEACEFGAITLHPIKKKVLICDLCEGDPKCVQCCPTDALMFATSEEIAQKARKKLTKDLADKLLSTK
jgi:Fe-S-cluster-containing dehydrogenase component